ncbi:uncharacterized protein LOC111715670 isoform X2 [Eurytemora carolleeae]|uniref:uncharacterized protein LOC111715670 isoform X2 n=1 Tax=Eurytemora carolleeae TaxID=1294199 RepID=UPI000C756672|nr:uncharacterized protein LOC111715670 isoform X2 [Eurytemora carolleeae]|eukprot:XP_023346794.1 uncharacterized protein LOC111715670 isoform X2 [Eurytemora affinis]
MHCIYKIDTLQCLAKKRSRGPGGRRLPSTKIKKIEENLLKRSSDSNDNLVLDAPADRNLDPSLIFGKDLLDAEVQGRVNHQEFDKIWFIRVPSIQDDSSHNLSSSPPPPSTSSSKPNLPASPTTLEPSNPPSPSLQGRTENVETESDQTQMSLKDFKSSRKLRWQRGKCTIL